MEADVPSRISILRWCRAAMRSFCPLLDQFALCFCLCGGALPGFPEMSGGTAFAQRLHLGPLWASRCLRSTLRLFRELVPAKSEIY